MKAAGLMPGQRKRPDEEEEMRESVGNEIISTGNNQ